MTPIGGSQFEYNFTQTWYQGTYNYTIWANNTAGFSNQTLTMGNFFAESNLTTALKTNKNAYIPNEIVNITDTTYTIVSFNVQAEQGFMVTSGVTSSTDSLSNTYQINKTFIVADSQVRAASTEDPNVRLGRVYFSSISNGYSSELTAERGSTTGIMINSYSVLQSDNIDVCHISHTMPNADGNEDVSLASCDVPLPSNYQEKCFVSTRHNVEASSGTNTCSEEQKVMANITSTTNLNLQRDNTACGVSVVEAQVVCFNDETNVTPVHLGSTHFDSGTTVGIGHSVNRDKSWLIYSCQSDGDGIEHANIECYLDGTSSVTCLTSGLGTTEASNQECVAYVIEFPGGRNEEVEHHVPGAEISNILQFDTSFSNPVDDLNKTLGFCAYSLYNNGEGNNHAKGEYPCYLLDEDTFYCERGQEGNGDPSHTFHCEVVQWPNATSTAYNPSIINNTGSTPISGHLLLSVLSNSSGYWENFETIVNDTTTGKRREINAGETLNLTNIWNGPGEGSGFNTDSNPGGIYRAFAAFISPNGTIMQDGLGNNLSGYYEFEIDFRPPDVILGFPENGTTNFGVSITVNYTATDPSGVDSCSIFHDQSGLFTLEETKAYNPSGENTFTISGFTENTWIKWNVRCNDTINNVGFTAEDEWFYMIVPPDFTLNSTDIDFDNATTIEGTNMTINATIYNIGGQEGTVKVQFFDGDPDTNGIQIGSNQSLLISELGGTAVASINFTTTIGPHTIHVILDPPLATNGTVNELNETNNRANRSIDINSWQDFYGNATITKILASSSIENVTVWENETSLTGSIFVADTESNINWASLKAIGQDLSGNNATDDFTEIDILLNTTNFTDSVANTFTTGGWPPLGYTSTIIRKQTVTNIPIIDSSENGNFKTGILWDSDDDTDSEYGTVDEEDLVFMSPFNKGKPGDHGTYDYEIQLPVKLREYDKTETSNVYFYFELN
ncbi:MAG: CARDB domain-containing protein [archaeon]